MRSAAYGINCHKLLFLSSLLFVSQLILSQESSADFLDNTGWLDKSEAKNWGKQLEELKIAETMLSKSNEKYLEIGNIQSNSDNEEKKKTKEIEKLEKEAQELSEKSLMKYKEIYANLHSILVKKIKEEDKKHPAYNEFVDLTNQANTVYNEARKSESIEKADKLTQGNEYQLRSIEKGIDIFTIDASSYSPEVFNESASQTSDDDILLNKELLEKYQQYLDDPSVPNPLTASELMGLEGEKATFSAFGKLWEDYKSGQPEQLPLAEQMNGISESDSLVQQTDENENSAVYNKENLLVENTANTLNTLNETVVSESNTVSYNESNSRTETNKNTSSGKEGTEHAKTFSGITPDTDNLYEFRVQVAASRTPLSLYQLQAIYKGNRTISEIKEENYYKYQIRGNNLLSDAQKICSQSGVDNAYLEAYDNLKRIPLGPAAEKAKLLENVVEKKGKARAFRQIDFSVQIAASKSRLSAEKLSGLFKCSDAITVVFEEGWYKYQVYVGKNLDNAFRILDQCCHKKAFIVAYKNGKRIKLNTAIQEYKIYTP